MEDMFNFKPVTDRYLMLEIIKPLILGVVGITIMMISGFLFELTDLIIIRKIEFSAVAQLLLYRIPSLMVQTFPLAVLFATLYSVGRLVKDNEFTALRLGGMSFYRTILPFMLVACLVAVSTYLINEKVAPWATHRSQNIIREVILQETVPGVEEKVFFRGPGDRFFYVGEVNPSKGTLEQIIVYEIKGRNELPRIITASSGRFYDDMWYLNEGTAIDFDQDGYPAFQVSFDQYELNVGQQIERFFGRQRTPQEMSRAELMHEIQLFSRSGLNVNSLLVDYHIKLAIPISAFIFVIIGAPLSISYGRGKGLAVVFSIILIFGYYIILSFSRSLGRNDLLPPLLAAWLPNLVFLGVGIVLMLREESLRFLGGSK